MALATSTSKQERSRLDPVRVMLVDDSAVVRGLITRILEKDGRCRVVASASNGKTAINTLKRHDVEVVVLDIEMPVMDGLEALPLLLSAKPGIQIVMASTLSLTNAKIGLQALELGAQDYIAKPSASEELREGRFATELIRKVETLGLGSRRKPVPSRSRPIKDRDADKKGVTDGRAVPGIYQGKTVNLRTEVLVAPKIIAIGSSTGGPAALSRVLSDLPPHVDQPILIAQHMPPTFTTILAQRLSKDCGRPCKEGEHGEPVLAGHVYVAPGDFHMSVEGSVTSPKIVLTQTPAENFCRPAVDPMLRSLADVFGKYALTIILTGMGSDGLAGCQRLAELGAPVFAQDESSSIVWGMPGAVATEGLCNAVLPVDEIGAAVTKVIA